MFSHLMNFHDFFIGMNVYVLSWFLHRNECIWSKNNVYVRMLDLTSFLTSFLTSWIFMTSSSYMFCHDFFIVYALSWLLHRNERKWPKNNVYVRMLDLTPFLTCFLTWRISSYMLCQNFFVYVLSWLHRKCFVKHERKWFVKTSSYMLCHDFIVHVLSWLFHRICFVKTSSS